MSATGRLYPQEIFLVLISENVTLTFRRNKYFQQWAECVFSANVFYCVSYYVCTAWQRLKSRRIIKQKNIKKYFVFILLPLSQHMSVTQRFAKYLLTSSCDLPLTSKKIDNQKANLLWCEISFNSPEEANM